MTLTATTDEIIAELKRHGTSQDRAGLERFGISGSPALGVRIPVLRRLAKGYRGNQQLAMQLFQQDYRETRILATMIADPARFTASQAESWMHKFADWELVDQACFNLFWRCTWAYQQCFAWSALEPEFSKRTPFSLMAKLAISDTQRPDADFLAWMPVIVEASSDERTMVKKAVNWSLRQIGKRNAALMQAAEATARSLAGSSLASARWIGRNALNEFAKKKATKEKKQ